MKSKHIIGLASLAGILALTITTNMTHNTNVQNINNSKGDLRALKTTIDSDSVDLDDYTLESLKDLKSTVSSKEYKDIESKLKKLAALDNAYYELQNDLNEILPEEYRDLIDTAYNEEPENEVIATYDISNNNFNVLEKGENFNSKNISNYKKLWDYSKKLIPNEYESMIKHFQVSTDGRDNTLAFVNGIPEPIKYFNYSIDIKDSIQDGKINKSNITDTIIHEFGHVLTLNGTQMDTYNPASETYNIEEGTLKANSYLNLFYNKFWKALLNDFETLGEEINEDEGLSEFYLKYESQFVDDYAATNPAEDIAESFMTFVVKDKPTGKTIADDKVRFFYDFEELVKMRDEIRSNMEK